MTFINENKECVEIVVDITMDYNGYCTYRIRDIYITPYRKRKSISVASQVRDQYGYRILDYNDRSEYIRQEYLKHCTEDQIWEAVQEAYRQMAPKKEAIVFRA